jgi:hypothetical protein
MRSRRFLIFFFPNGKKLDLGTATLIVLLLLLRTAAPIIVVSGWLTVTDSAARSGIENGNFFFEEFEIGFTILGHKHQRRMKSINPIIH